MRMRYVINYTDLRNKLHHTRVGDLEKWSRNCFHRASRVARTKARRSRKHRDRREPATAHSLSLETRPPATHSVRVILDRSHVVWYFCVYP